MMKPRSNPILRLIDERPRVVATLLGPKDLIAQARKAKKDGAEILEIRIDSLSWDLRGNVVSVVSKIKSAARLPILVTIRDPKEQGAVPGLVRLSDDQRLTLYRQLLPLSDLIDVELRARIAPAVVTHARQLNVGTILSYHDFSGVPGEAMINKLLLQFKRLRGDIFKIAARPNDRLTLLRFLLLGLSKNSVRRTFIAMGDSGKISRLAGFCFGSCLTYGFASRAAAPGQVPVKDLATIYRSLRTKKP